MKTMTPSYIALHRNGHLGNRIDKVFGLLESCVLCPRKCGVNRLKDERGFCSTGRKARIASYNAHFGEESPLVGRYGSGTIFLSSCNLLCNFCQNFEISHLREGFDMEPEQLAFLMIELFKKGCHNINFVTPTHVVPQILEALPYAIEQGLNVPLVYNSSGYDSPETLALLEGVFDIYMPDFKFWESKWGEKYCRAPNYKDVAVQAIREMHRQVGDLVTNKDGIAVRGLLIRHLVMPHNVAGTKEIVKFISREISPHTYVNVMDQYRPCGEANKDDLISRRLNPQEFRDAMDAAKNAGITRLDSRDRIRILFGL